MSPQDKAVELVDKFARIDGYVDSIDLSKCEFEKKCALIVVNELIEETDYYFWTEVKKEIERL
jgi:hypothetical protein